MIIEIVTHIQVSPLAFLKSEMHFFINLGDQNVFWEKCTFNIKSELSALEMVCFPIDLVVFVGFSWIAIL